MRENWVFLKKWEVVCVYLWLYVDHYLVYWYMWRYGTGLVISDVREFLIEAEEDPNKSYILTFKKNLYDFKNERQSWFDMLSNVLLDPSFFLSNVDVCVYYKWNTIILVHVDACIIFAKAQKNLKNIIKLFTRLTWRIKTHRWWRVKTLPWSKHW